MSINDVCVSPELGSGVPKKCDLFNQIALAENTFLENCFWFAITILEYVRNSNESTYLLLGRQCHASCKMSSRAEDGPVLLSARCIQSNVLAHLGPFSF